jgi:hypothetical protein
MYYLADALQKQMRNYTRLNFNVPLFGDDDEETIRIVYHISILCGAQQKQDPVILYMRAEVLRLFEILEETGFTRYRQIYYFVDVAV